MLKVTRGYSPQYLLKEVATGRENYYTGAVAAGEPPGRWWGSGAELLGLRGLVDAQDMTGVYERFLDPREEGFTDPARWDEVYTLGQTGRRYLSEEELYAAALEREPELVKLIWPHRDGFIWPHPRVGGRGCGRGGRRWCRSR